MIRSFTGTVVHPRTGRAEDPSAVPPVAAAARTAFDGAGFLLLCLLTGTGPSALRRQFDGGWDAGFAQQPPA